MSLEIPVTQPGSVLRRVGEPYSGSPRSTKRSDRTATVKMRFVLVQCSCNRPPYAVRLSEWLHRPPSCCSGCNNARRRGKNAMYSRGRRDERELVLELLEQHAGAAYAAKLIREGAHVPPGSP